MKNSLLHLMMAASLSSFAFANNNSINISENNFSVHIPIHSHSTAENEAHAAYCENIGGIDITDQMDLNLTKDTNDAVVCLNPTNNNTFSKQHPNDIDLAIKAPSKDISRSAPNYSAEAISAYEDPSGGNPEIRLGFAVEKDLCAAVGTGQMPDSKGVVFIRTQCNHQTKFPGNRETYAQVVANNQYVEEDTGTITEY